MNEIGETKKLAQSFAVVKYLCFLEIPFNRLSVQHLHRFGLYRPRESLWVAVEIDTKRGTFFV
jgi:hypothetical protein